jgi:uncharacterized membrane protein YjgN (DUF898 family)
MDNQKPLQFNGTAGSYFVVFLVTLVMTYIPFFGWAFLINYTSEWMADNSLVNGKKVAYASSYSETLKFVVVNGLLVFVTFGIYIFWATPKAYRFIVDHVSYTDGSGRVEGSPEPVAETPAETSTEAPAETPAEETPAPAPTPEVNPAPPVATTSIPVASADPTPEPATEVPADSTTPPPAAPTVG